MKNVKKILCGTLMGLLFSSTSFAIGGWTSGGGELIRDTQNPWFISNTKEVRYCILVDEKEFGQTKSFAQTQVANAIQFWKNQLADLNYVSMLPVGELRLATQNFIEVPCGSNHDVAFQFAVLNQEQKENLGDLSRTVAISVRTDYDRVNLKGKGFVYVNKNSAFPINPWTRAGGARVMPILVHELGHIFGLQHTENVYSMSESFAEELVQVERADMDDLWLSYFSLQDGWKKISLFRHNNANQYLEMCGSSMPQPGIPIGNFSKKDKKSKVTEKNFFGANEDDNCSGVKLSGNKFEYFSGKNSTTLIGEALLESVQGYTFDFMEKQSLIKFWMPTEQKVFCQHDEPNCHLMEYIYKSRFEVASFLPLRLLKGTYKSVDGKIKRPIAIRANPYGYVTKITGELDGKIYISVGLGY